MFTTEELITIKYSLKYKIDSYESKTKGLDDELLYIYDTERLKKTLKKVMVMLKEKMED